jgi:hypothetical protein
MRERTLLLRNTLCFCSRTASLAGGQDHAAARTMWSKGNLWGIFDAAHHAEHWRTVLGWIK